jgi:hypothetical protein
LFKTRSFASTFPCGSKENCETLAETNNIAEEFLQLATRQEQILFGSQYLLFSSNGELLLANPFVYHVPYVKLI